MYYGLNINISIGISIGLISSLIVLLYETLQENGEPQNCLAEFSFTIKSDAKVDKEDPTKLVVNECMTLYEF